MKNKQITLREVLRETLNRSYNGHNEGCFDCAAINELVDHFLQNGVFTIYRVVDHIACNLLDTKHVECGCYMRKEFAKEDIKDRKKANKKKNKSYGHDYGIDEIDVKI